MRKNIFCEYDPFRTLFNMIFTDWVSVLLLVLLLVSSVLVYRPFCRTMCPVGVILGWISLLPGARRMSVKKECVNCGLCNKECAMHAISRTSEKTVLDSENCITCGECLTTCRKGGIKYDLK
jgi:polyferredoxin